MSIDQFRRRRPPPPPPLPPNPNPNPNPFDDDSDDDDAPRPSRATLSMRGSTAQNPTSADTAPDDALAVPHDPMLDRYERRLQEDVDADFFHEPEKFQALNRVIDIIGDEIGSGGKIARGDDEEMPTDFSHLPAYRSIRQQQRIVEEAIDHMAVRHCADLNSSVAAVGRMSRKFDEAKLRVRNLRRQVRDVKDGLRLGDLGDMGDAVVRVVSSLGADQALGFYGFLSVKCFAADQIIWFSLVLFVHGMDVDVHQSRRLLGPIVSVATFLSIVYSKSIVDIF